MTNEELKEEFLKYFKQEQWDELEMETRLTEAEFEICDRFLHMNPIPVIYSELKVEAKYNKSLDSILINTSYHKDFYTSFKLMCIELRHKFQIEYLKTPNSSDVYLALMKGYELESEFSDYDDPNKLGEYLSHIKEIDAMSFMVLMVKEFFNIDYIYPEPTYNEILQIYIRYFKDFLIEGTF